MILRPALTLATAVLSALGLTACGLSAAHDQRAEGEQVTVKNCGQDATFRRGSHLMVYDTQVAIALAAGARPEMDTAILKVSDRKPLEAKFGEDAKSLNYLSDKHPTLESVIAHRPDVVVAGWNYGFSEARQLTPALLKEKGINSYLLSESCRQADGKSRGIMDPWDAVRTDIRNLGAITGHSDQAEKSVADIERRLTTLRQAPQATNAPTVFLVDTAKDTILTSGRFGGPQAVITAAGGRSMTEGIEKTWTRVGWEQLTAANPDVIVFVDYDAQTVSDKIAALRTNPATKDLKAVKSARFLNLPYATWTSSPLNVDAAESLRKKLESWKLVPASTITPALDLEGMTPQQ